MKEISFDLETGVKAYIPAWILDMFAIPHRSEIESIKEATDIEYAVAFDSGLFFIPKHLVRIAKK